MVFGKYKKPLQHDENKSGQKEQENKSSNIKRLKPVNFAYSKDIDDHMNYIFPGRETGLHIDPSGAKYQIDINIMYPIEDEPYYVIYTQGMSSEDMILPEAVEKEYPEFKRAELFMLLPADWDIDNMTSTYPKHETYWPMQLLRMVARYHYEFFTWVAPGYTVEYSSFANNTKLSAAMLVSLGDDIAVIKTKDNKQISLYLVLPIYKEEAKYKLKYGYDEFIEKYSQEFSSNTAEGWVVDINRKNIAE